VVVATSLRDVGATNCGRDGQVNFEALRRGKQRRRYRAYFLSKSGTYAS
jgi:hypothetical protein